MVQPLRKILWWFLKKLNTELPYEPATPLLGRIPEKIENRDSNEDFYRNVHSSTLHNSQKVEETQMSINGYMDKQIMVLSYNGILFSHKS